MRGDGGWERERAFYQRLLDLGSQEDLEPLLLRALELITEVTGAAQGYIELYEEGRDTPRWWRAQGFSPEELEGVRGYISRGVIAEAIATGETIETVSAMTDPRFSSRASVCDYRVEAVLCAPVGGPAPAGVIYLQGRDGDAFEPRDREAIERFARQLALLSERLMTRIRQVESEDLTQAIRERFRADGLLGRSEALAAVLEKASVLAPLELTLLITGPTGTGKSALARTIALNSPRAAGPFLEVNCAALPDELLESELFGAVAGGHSTALRDRGGKVAAAEGGTLFLDEIGELSVSSQAKLLQLLQDKVYYPVGGSEPVVADVRILCATNCELDERRRLGLFREDLYHRLSVLPLRMPGLEERREDIPLLAAHFARTFGEEYVGRPMTLTPAARLACQETSWPGHVRELRGRIQAGVILAGSEGAGAVERRHLFPGDVDRGGADSMSFQEATRRFQRRLLEEVLTEQGWNVVQAAKCLGITRSHLYNLIHSHGLSRPG